MSPRLAKRAMVFVAAANLCGRRAALAFRAASSCVVQRANTCSPAALGGARQIHASAMHRQLQFPTFTTRLREQSNDDDGSVEPTWTYVPYQPPRKPARNTNARRRFSTADEWTVPSHIPIPEDRLQISFARASGAGGQNVNKVNTKVELRFHVDSADWIPREVRDRLKTNEANRMNGEGYMTVTSQEHRTQLKNRKEAVKKLEDLLRGSWARPKVRKMRKGLTKEAKKNRRENKKKVSLKKESRRRVEW